MADILDNGTRLKISRTELFQPGSDEFTMPFSSYISLRDIGFNTAVDWARWLNLSGGIASPNPVHSFLWLNLTLLNIRRVKVILYSQPCDMWEAR